MRCKEKRESGGVGRRRFDPLFEGRKFGLAAVAFVSTACGDERRADNPGLQVGWNDVRG